MDSRRDGPRAERRLGADDRRLGREHVAAATTARLRGLLDAARAVTDDPGLAELLQEVARRISEELGWAVVINAYRPAWDDFVATASHGVAPEGWDVLEGARYDWAEWTPLLDDRHERRGAYLVPAGTPPVGPPVGAVWAPQFAERADPHAWRADDELLIPLRHSDGHFLGILTLDAPASGLRPSDAELDVLVASAADAALALELAQTTVDAARHAATLDRLLLVSSGVAAAREIGPVLREVVEGITGALGFGRVVVELLGADGALRPRAGTDAGAPSLAPLRPGELAMLLDPGFAVEGCFVLGRDEAAGRLPEGRRALLASGSNGRGWRAWDDHVVVVPLHDAAGELAGIIWVDDPVDRLLPDDDRLQALHRFSALVTGALIAADRYERLATVSLGDPLTELGNRRAFVRELGREVARTGRTGGASVLVLADVQDCLALSGGADLTPAPDAHSRLLGKARVLEAGLRLHDRTFRIDGGLFGTLLTGGRRPPDTAAVTLRMDARLRSVGAREGVRVRFGTAAFGPQPERPEAVFRRAAESLLAAGRVHA